MTFSKVSVLLPTRGRLERLGRFIESFRDTVRDTNSAELVFRVDNDDLDSIRFLADYDWPVLMGPRLQGYRSLPSFYNDMAKIANGDVLVCGNDDMLFQTPNWPARVLEVANRYPDGIFNIGVNVGLNDDKVPFSIVSRQLRDALGFINDTRLLFSDIFLRDLMAHFDRNVRCNDVMFFHDWAGHGQPDQTRLDANSHEVDMVFADTQGNWTEEYRELNERVVREAAEKIARGSDVLPSIAVANFLQYRPPMDADPKQTWPPPVAPLRWYGGYDEPAIHYHQAEAFALLKALYQLPMQRGTAVITSFNNGLPSILWGQVFDKVVTVKPSKIALPNVEDGKYTLVTGAIGETRFLKQLSELAGPVDCLILDDLHYATLISPYFTFRRAMRRPGTIVLFNTAGASAVHDGVTRFITDLRNGSIDGICHNFQDIALPGGVGVSYEQVT